MKYQKQALFIYDEQSIDFIATLKNNDFGTEIIAVEKAHFLSEPLEYIAITSHLILAGDIQLIDELVQYAYSHSANGQHCTLGFLPLESQKILRNAYQLSKHLEDNIEVALRDETQAINLLTCNDQLVQFKVVVGQIPLLEAWHSDLSPGALIKNVILGIKQFFQLSLEKVSIETQRGRQIKTLASALFVVNQNQSSRLTRVLLQKSSMRSEQLSLMIISPYSAVEYFLFLFSLIFHFNKETVLPHAVSNIKSEEITIDMDSASKEMFKVKLDENKTTMFPLHFRVIKKALKINAPEAFWQLNP
ncbi:MAG: hypothetical protein GQ546_04370, partial [Gammaproteobacteria bacterium]|nr:hypothetical protein [Gammaproteobacteria bacterium]